MSFGPARAAADSFRDALGTLAATSRAKDRCRVEAFVAKAVLSVREIQVRQAPHIAEASDATMTRLENDMAGLEATAKAALSELSGVIAPSARPALAAAQTEFDRFKDVSEKLVALSRRNSNVRALDLSLRVKPGLTTACDESLRVLQDALAKQGSQATR